MGSYDFSALIAFLQSLVDALVALAGKLGIQLPEIGGGEA